ncbi:MAG: hypothetical protein WA728_30130, partial [Xanthobacteraceae bacterium]
MRAVVPLSYDAQFLQEGRPRRGNRSLEYAIDVAQACRERGIKTVAVSAGYISPEPRIELFRHMDAANIDLKGFSEEFYKNLCSGKLASVLE